MINLLPVSIKQQLRFARRNSLLLRLLMLELLLASGITATLVATGLFLDRTTETATTRLEEQRQRLQQYQEVEVAVADINIRLGIIKSLQTGQTRFSQLLVDLAAATPSGATITAIELTGDDKKPVRLTVAIDSFRAAVGFREALVVSPRIEAADIENISGTVATIVIGFKPGQAR